LRAVPNLELCRATRFEKLLTKEMKMKNAKWILGLIGAFSLQVSATDLSKIEAGLNGKLQQKHLHGKVHMRDSGTDPNPVPIRQVNVRVKFVKTTLTKNSSGGYDSTDTYPCTTTTTFNVYDNRNDSGVTVWGSSDSDRVQCSSTLLGNPVVVHLGGVVSLLNGALFGTTLEDFKLSTPILYYDSPMPGTSSDGNETYAFDAAGSTDLTATSMLSSISPSSAIQSCTVDSNGNSSCTAPINEYFSAVVDVQD
jgi:hypothetical protein